MAALLCLLGLIAAQTGPATVSSDAAFEEHVLADPQASLFLFTSAASEANRERSAAALEVLQSLGARLAPLIKTAHGDAASLKGIATEFNIRARRCPKLLLFAQRARQADVLELGEVLNLERIEAQVKGLLIGSRLSISADGAAMKATLAVGSPADEL